MVPRWESNPHDLALNGSLGPPSREKTMRFVMVPRAGVEPARPFGQRILSPAFGTLPDLTKRYTPVFTRIAVVKVSLWLALYQRVPPPS